ncbi:alanine racemase [Curvibacter sp. APW13]|uniref:alanine racemase n=1 Tax=Curvibacter sp. APW13 TaxID=3077236 RepID=UPI0028DF1679|nr:alanine racemase [Curvibacter sp. APW13]MDT8991474.1 alanine racemase [Curvibacter sp. APW13]
MKLLNRRSALGLMAVGAGAALLRPGVHGAPHAPYFADLSQALNAAGLGTPTLVIDRQRLQANVAQVTKNIGGRMGLRIVAKSLPSLALLDEVRRGAGTDRLMVFSLPQLLQLSRADSDFLLGKPMPVAAAARYYREVRTPPAPDKLQWLVDTPQRLAQYRDLARQIKRPMAVSFEIDVGLHRGGIDSAQTMAEMLTLLREEPLLQWRGLMGYDAHVSKIPDIAGSRQRAIDHARSTYAAYAQQAKEALGEGARAALFNAAGSPTYRLYDGSGIENELSVGSAMVKGTDFDTPLLDDLSPAVFIATPVLKTPEHFRMPKGVEPLGDIVRLWDRNQQQAYFIYGGNWLAEPVSPAGLAGSGLYGTSSNQQMLVGSGLQGLAVDDWVFFRPRQSEAVLQQFGDIAVLDHGKITGFWQPMAATA